MPHYIYYNGREIYVFGDNKYGQLGLGDYKDRNRPTLLLKDNQIKNIITGEHHSIILKNNGQVFVFGRNDCGQLGLNHYKNRAAPKLLMTDPDIVQIFCGSNYTFILKNNSEIYVFGCYEHGNVRRIIDYSVDVPSPKLLTINIKITKIIGYYDKVYFLRNNGDIVIFDDDAKYFDENQSSTDTRTNMIGFKLFLSDMQIKQFICGSEHAFIMKNNGEIFCMGNNLYGQLGLGKRISKCKLTKFTALNDDQCQKQLMCGNKHTIILYDNGSVFVFGKNKYGQLGLGDHKRRYEPTLLMVDPAIKQIICDKDYTLIFKNNGEIYAMGSVCALGCNRGHSIGARSIIFDKPKLYITNEDIILFNNMAIKKICWNNQIYHSLSVTKKAQINTFLLVCKYYHNKTNVKIVKDMRNMIIGLLF